MLYSIEISDGRSIVPSRTVPWLGSEQPYLPAPVLGSVRAAAVQASPQPGLLRQSNRHRSETRCTRTRGTPNVALVLTRVPAAKSTNSVPRLFSSSRRTALYSNHGPDFRKWSRRRLRCVPGVDHHLCRSPSVCTQASTAIHQGRRCLCDHQLGKYLTTDVHIHLYRPVSLMGSRWHMWEQQSARSLVRLLSCP